MRNLFLGFYSVCLRNLILASYSGKSVCAIWSVFGILLSLTQGCFLYISPGLFSPRLISPGLFSQSELLLEFYSRVVISAACLEISSKIQSKIPHFRLNILLAIRIFATKIWHLFLICIRFFPHLQMQSKLLRLRLDHLFGITSIWVQDIRRLFSSIYTWNLLLVQKYQYSRGVCCIFEFSG